MNCFTGSKKLLLAFSALFLLPGLCGAQFLFFDATDSTKIDQQSASPFNVGPGIVVFDVDNDGWDDLYLPGGSNPDKLYRNNHDGTFTNIADSDFSAHYIRAYTYSRGGTAFDYDNDGLTDLYVCTGGTPILWKNNGNGKFTNSASSAGLLSSSSLDENQSNGATFGDFNGDGFNDLYVARWVDEWHNDTANGKFGYANKGFPNWFYVNNGNGTFTERAKEFGIDGDTGCSNIALFFDYDRDGDLDLLVGNDFGVEEMPNRVYKNLLMETGKATFARVDSAIGLEQHLFCMGICPNDYNRDGQFDFYETSAGGDVLMQNNKKNFTNVSAGTHVPDGHVHGNKDTVTISWTPVFADFDNDGWEDAFIAHGFIGLQPPWEGLRTDTSVFLHNIGGVFEDITEQSGIVFNLKAKGAALIDYDHDGKVDIAVGSDLGGIATKDFRIFHNITPDEDNGHWMQIKFTAKRTAKEAIGTTVDVWTEGIVHSRQISTGGGQCSCGPLTAFVGLGSYTKADSIVVFWPADSSRHRQIDRYNNIPANHMYHITENMNPYPDTTLLDGIEAPPSSHLVSLYPNPATDVLHVKDLPPQIQKHFEIYDLLGIKREDFLATESALSISLKSLKPGCYALRIISNKEVITKQFVKE